MENRIEKDSFGPIEVPAAQLWGAQTQRSLHHFHISSEKMPPELVAALAQVKRAAAAVNRSLGKLPADKADAIIRAADEVLEGRHPDEFPLAVWQTGSGTQSTMNMNEVLANRASELMGGERGEARLLHPNDHVNMGQSSNDMFPTAMHVAAAIAVAQHVLPALARLRGTLEVKSRQFVDIVKIGRTHLQDATPLTLGQEFGAYANQVYRCGRRIEPGVTNGTNRLAQGGTAVGTGLNAPRGFAEDFCKAVSDLTGHPFIPAENSFEALASNDPLVHLSGTLNTLAVALTKIANDIRLLGSGPRCGFGEIDLPANEPGSSIMPGKVNPTQCEMLTMVAGQVMGNHVTATIGGMQGHLELNVFKPLIGANVLRSIDLLATAMEGFAERCVDGIEPNRDRIADLLDRSLMLVTALAPEIGYDAAAKIAKHAHVEGLTLKEAGLALGLVDAETFDRVVRPESMLGR